MKLSELFPDYNGQDNPVIDSLAVDSREPNPNGLFFCITGLRSDGHRYIDQAVRQGAVAVVHSAETDLPAGVIGIRVADTSEELLRVTNLFYAYPSAAMKIYAVTGTNGKTTTAYIMENLLSHVERCAYNGTVGLRINGQLQEGIHMTTPDNLTLTRMIAQVRDAGCDSLAMEISSHALDQRRADNVAVDVAVYTNLTHEHLDYHGTMASYCEAKCRLFRGLKSGAVSVLNRDDAYYEVFRAASAVRTVSYGMHPESTYRISDLSLTATGSHFILHYDGAAYPVETDLVSAVNMYNLTAALAAVHEAGHDLSAMIARAAHIEMNIGRFQAVPNQHCTVLVDFAHTPDGFEKIYAFAKEITSPQNRIITVFGSAGQRDKLKRPILGAVSDRYCDRIILCEDDIRDEDPVVIAAEIAEGIEHKEKVSVIADRYEAIAAAIRESAPGDTVLLLSKGLERHIPKADGDEPWMGDDRAAKKALHEFYGEAADE
ncbi:MAG: UDP-N-acetylmuramoyl-L-alanyl-D-glutamate--2,6-diaminopimelate ligase [Eubacteriales bacterium]|nr:UDP-N-acetylmuramoyl-L-alanyl-D-glutamate--2,6-diaminopimelate ligase [Eubacteriales bacterium]